MIQRIRSFSFGLALIAFSLFLASPALAQEGYVLDGFGGVHAINGAPVIGPASPYFGFDAAEAIVIIPSGDGYLVLDAFGAVHPGGTASAVSPGPPYFGFDIARDIALTPSGSATVIPSTGTFVNANGNDEKYQSLFGTSFSGTKTGAGNFFPTACMATGLRATTTNNVSPGTPRTMMGSESVTITVMVNEVDSALSCTVGTGQTSCTSGSSVSISADDRVGYKLVYTNVDTATHGIFYIHKGFTCS